MPKRTKDNIKVGARFKNNHGDWFTVIEIKNLRKITVVFDDDPENCRIKTKQHIQEGRVLNKNKPAMWGVGFIGYGEHSSRNQKVAYSAWSNMITRCYWEDYKDYSNYGGRGVYVTKQWHNFQNFCSWFLCNSTEGFEMDKDLKGKTSKVYSPDTVVFLPPRVNVMFTGRRSERNEYGIGVRPRKDGRFSSNITYDSKNIYLGYFGTADEAYNAYKTAKESAVKIVANEYKDVITEEAYNLLMEWEAERFPD